MRNKWTVCEEYWTGVRFFLLAKRYHTDVFLFKSVDKSTAEFTFKTSTFLFNNFSLCEKSVLIFHISVFAF